MKPRGNVRMDPRKVHESGVRKPRKGLTMVRFVNLVVFLVMLLIAVSLTYGDYPSALQEKATILQESSGNTMAIGDKYDKKGHLKPPSEWAYGDHQLHQEYVDDVNRKFGTHHKATDCLGNALLSSWIYREYMNMYATSKALGHKPTEDDMSGIHNGGPRGWKSKMTVGYRQQVRAKRINLASRELAKK